MEKSNNLLKVLPRFRSKKADDASSLSPKDKRYLQQVEKALLTFESLEEWADYIAFLSRLQKALQLPQDSKGVHTITWIPKSLDTANKLSLCLSPKLPNGVHQKTLSLYETIFTALTIDALNNEIYVWLPGILPVLSFGSIQVKSQIIKLFKLHLLPNINHKNINVVAKPIILSFLSGLDDENSEGFGDVMELMDSLKTKLDDDSHFWKSLFLGIISNPEKRLGALFWCNKRLPIFNSIKLENGNTKYTDEARACIEPSPGLLIRSFATAINTKTIFNPANDIIIIRGFFDLMLSHLPLNSEVLTSSPKDKDLLMKACIGVLLKKDMSLNRRFWNWLLGPDAEVDATNARSKYFEVNGLETLATVLLDGITGSNIHGQIDSFKMSLSLVIDKWEISHLLIPKILLPILNATFERSNEKAVNFNEYLSASQGFFNGVETSNIWHLIVSLIQQSKLELTEFILANFDINESEMKSDHIPLALIVLMSNYTPLSHWFSSVSLLLHLVSPKGLESGNYTEKIPNDGIVQKVLGYYETLVAEEQAELPFSRSQLSCLLYGFFKVIVVNEIESINSWKLCDLFETLVGILPSDNDFKYRDDDILNLLLKRNEQVQTKEEQNLSSKEKSQKKLTIAFSTAKLFSLMSKTLSVSEKSKIVKIVSINLWPSLISSDPTMHQVEAVKCLYDMILNTSTYYVEAAISGLLLQSDYHDRIKAMVTLWSHSNSHESDLVLERPLQLILDDLLDEGNINHLNVDEFIRAVLKSGHSNRLLKMLTNPLLDFELMHLSKEFVHVNDDLAKFSYHLTIILKVINSNNKNLKEAFNNEFAVMDNSSKLKIIRSNEWDISTYKSLLFYSIEKFLSLKLEPSVLSEPLLLKDYYNCVDNCLEIFNILITGNEPDFSDKFHRMIDNGFYFMSFESIPYQIELVQCQYLKCVFHLLKISEEARISLNILHMENEKKQPLLISFIIKGIQTSQTSVLLSQWMALLTRSLYLFNESIFSILSMLISAILGKIDSYFDKIVNKKEISNLVDLESSINELIGGIEDLLSISHSYLLTSRFRNKDSKSTPSNIGDSSFLGNVIQGVFQIESPSVRTTEQNRLFTILVAFQDSIRIAFKIWNWTDSKPKSQPSESPIGSDKSMMYLGNRLKFRSKKLLETLMDLERQEVIENLIDIDKEFSSSIKLLHLLDGGRSQITLPSVFDSVLTRTYPSILPDPRKSHLNVGISDKELSRFLVNYFESIDTDTVTDIWPFSLQFFKDIMAHHTHFKSLIPNFLKVLYKLSLKLKSSKFGEDKKHKKELSDVFVKMLGLSVSGKRLLFSSSEEKEALKEGIENDSDDDDDTPQGVQEELMEALTEIVPYFQEIIQEPEKVSGCINIIIANLITPQIKGKKVPEISVRVLYLLNSIGQNNPNRAWKTMINEFFMDPSFFSLSTVKSDAWKTTISAWISVESTEKFNELINRISTSSSGGASTLFMYNEKLELENKILALKRISYLILIQPEDFFLTSLDQLFEKVELSLTNSAPVVFKSYISLLFRAVTVKFNELYLLPRWIVIGQELISIFDLIGGKTMKELSFMNEEELQGLLYGCKLLDQLLLLSSDEFNLQEWLFVNGTFDIDTDTDYLISIIDRISKENDLTILKESPVKLNPVEGNKKVPLLNNVKSIHSIANLRNFFESLSYLNFERVFGLYEIDMGVCEKDILNDLFS